MLERNLLTAPTSVCISFLLLRMSLRVCVCVWLAGGQEEVYEIGFRGDFVAGTRRQISSDDAADAEGSQEPAKSPDLLPEHTFWPEVMDPILYPLLLD